MTSTTALPGTDVVHVWQGALDLGSRDLNVLHGYLSTEERDRADRCRSAPDRRRHIAARGWLRYVLGSHLGDDPRALVFTEDAHGKPQLAGAAGEILQFNASHSDAIALYAVAHDRDVGVDVERVQKDFPIYEVASRFFPKSESDELAALPSALQARAFYEAWTAKEAYLKAIGVGLGGLAESEVDTSVWSLHSLDVGPGYAAALAVAGSPTVPAAATALHLSLT